MSDCEAVMVHQERIATAMSEYVQNCRPQGGSDGTSGTTDLGGWIPAGTCTGGTSSGTGANLYYSGYEGGIKCDANGILVPNNAGGSETTYTRDYVYYRTTAKRLARFGGVSYDGANCGAFACHLYSYVSDSRWIYGASPSFHAFGTKKNGGFIPSILFLHYI